jgi:hypothetical protein
VVLAILNKNATETVNALRAFCRKFFLALVDDLSPHCPTTRRKRKPKEEAERGKCDVDNER